MVEEDFRCINIRLVVATHEDHGGFAHREVALRFGTPLRSRRTYTLDEHAIREDVDALDWRAIDRAKHRSVVLRASNYEIGIAQDAPLAQNDALDNLAMNCVLVEDFGPQYALDILGVVSDELPSSVEPRQTDRIEPWVGEDDDIGSRNTHANCIEQCG